MKVKAKADDKESLATENFSKSIVQQCRRYNEGKHHVSNRDTTVSLSADFYLLTQIKFYWMPAMPFDYILPIATFLL